MENRALDRLARALGAASTRRRAIGAVLAIVGAASGTRDVGAKPGKKRCTPVCATGQTCRRGICTCDDGGEVCGSSCCGADQRCEDTRCTAVQRTCILAGERCKNVGRRCCDGRACGSGQDGIADVACYVPAGGACRTTSDCVFGSACTDRTCVADPLPTPTPTPTVTPPCIPGGQGGCVRDADCCAGTSCKTGTCRAPIACTLTPTFPVTDDAGVNGENLQLAVKQAKTGSPNGSTIVLAPGEYRFDKAFDVNVPVGLQVTKQSVTIVRCHPDAVVTLSCPAGNEFSACVDVIHFGGEPYTNLVLDGVGIDYGLKQDGFPGASAFYLFCNQCYGNGGLSVTLRNLVIESASNLGIQIEQNHASKVFIQEGVSFVMGQGAVELYNNDASYSTITCTAPPVVSNPPIRCGGGGRFSPSITGCGCPTT